MMMIVERVFCPGGRELSDSDKDSAENGEEEEGGSSQLWKSWFLKHKEMDLAKNKEKKRGDDAS